ncbi:MAG: membrane dipeptidase [Parcubacteria group bacterium]|nr:membrane dipeptidase [Parcubacteria group bacterium]
MRYADFLGFLFPQNALIKKDKKELVIDPNIKLDLCGVTSVPPFMKKISEIVREHKWFCEILKKQNQNNKIKIFCGLQHPPENAIPSDISYLGDIGIKYMTLAYETESVYGGGFATPQAPLTEEGKWLLRMMARAGIILDLSHAGHRTAREALVYIHEKNLRLKVVASHTGCWSIYSHYRNLPDDVLLGIKELNGIVGLATVTFKLDQYDNTLNPFFNHFNHALNILGEDHIALGTDGLYRIMDAKEEAARFEVMKKKLDPRGNFKARYPDQPMELNRPDRLTVIENEMIKRGISVKTAEKIMGENLAKFFSEL